MLTDTKSLFDIKSKGSCTSKKRNVYDHCAARKVYKVQKISNIVFVKDLRNLADDLTIM